MSPGPWLSCSAHSHRLLLVEIPADEDDRIRQRADAGDVDGDDVARPQGERLVGHDPVPVSRTAPTGKVSAAISHAARSSNRRVMLAVLVDPSNATASPRCDAEGDVERRRRGCPGRNDPWPQSAGPVVHLRLWQIQRVLALDRAAADVIADDVAEDVTAGVEYQAELRLRRVPRRVGADADRLSVGDHPLRLWP